MIKDIIDLYAQGSMERYVSGFIGVGGEEQRQRS